MGYDPVVLVDAALKYEIDREEEFRKLLQNEKIRQVPADTDADYFILRLAKEFEGKILSNDQYSEYQEEYSDILEDKVNFMIVENEIVFKGLE